MKVFISQPTKDKIREVIEIEREELERMIKVVFNREVEVINSIQEVESSRVDMLGKSISMFADANLVVFDEYTYQSNPGCSIEFDVCRRYNIPYITYDALEMLFKACMEW